MRKVIKIDEKLTVMVNDNVVNILDDTTFIPLTIDDMKLIAENLDLCMEEEEQPKKQPARRTTAKAKTKVETPPVEPKVEIKEEVEEFKELPPNPFK